MIDLAAIEAWPLALQIRRSIWAYPVLEAIHIVSFATMFGSLTLLELRVFGIERLLPLVPFARLAVRTAVVAFACAAIAGVLMLISNASELVPNPAFLVKLGLILIAGCNALWFHRRGSLERHDRVAKAQAMSSLMLWVGVIFAGRLIAYV